MVTPYIVYTPLAVYSPCPQNELNVLTTAGPHGSGSGLDQGPGRVTVVVSVAAYGVVPTATLRPPAVLTYRTVLLRLLNGTRVRHKLYHTLHKCLT